MIIKKKRIRSLSANVYGFHEGEKVVVSLVGPERFAKRLSVIGFTKKLEPGEQILPAVVGPVTRYNADGRDDVHKDKPKEIALRQKDWKWMQFQGRYERVERSKIVTQSYRRYPRTHIDPPSVELTISQRIDGKKIVIASPERFTQKGNDALVHKINMFLELFGECELVKEDLSSVIRAPIKRINWEILPKGAMPWSKLHSRLGRVLDKRPQGVRAVVDKRFETINGFRPEFVAVGRGGFDGYVVFAFPSRDLFILESTQLNNATYILDKDWETLSTLTKSEILNKNLHKKRVLHREEWFSEMGKILLFES